MPLPKHLFVTGTDTDVGKTVIAAILTLGLKGTYWKPIQSGPEPDTAWVRKVTELPPSHFLKESYCLSAPLSPHAAAELEKIQIDPATIELPPSISPLIIEGAGGVLVPLCKNYTLIDLIKKFNIPTLIVSKNVLGTINHTLLTIRELKRHRIPLLGVVLNGKKNPINKAAILQYGKVPVIAEIEPLELDRTSLQHAFNTHFGHL